MKMNNTEKAISYEAPEVEILDLGVMALCDNDPLISSPTTGKMSEDHYTTTYESLLG